MPDENIQNELKLQSLDGRINAGILDDQKRKKLIMELQALIRGALFLENNKERKIKWAKTLPFMADADLLELKDVIIRENLRYKIGERKIKFSNRSLQKDLKQKSPQEDEEDFDLPDFDFMKTPENSESKEVLDNLSFVLIFAIAEVFEKTEVEDFNQTKLKLKINPGGFSNILSKKSAKALGQIEEGLRGNNNKWRDFFKKDWPLFVETAARSFLLAKQAESEINKAYNPYPEIKIDPEEVKIFYSQIA